MAKSYPNHKAALISDYSGLSMTPAVAAEPQKFSMDFWFN